MPMRLGRANKYVKLGMARYETHRKLGIRYLRLLKKPVGFDIQQIGIALNSGYSQDGLTVLSRYCHHENFILNHNIQISKRMQKRKMYRRNRRTRLRNRPCRVSFRKMKINATSLSQVNFRMWAVNKLREIYPIKKFLYEKPDFDNTIKIEDQNIYLLQFVLVSNLMNKLLRRKSIEVKEWKWRNGEYLFPIDPSERVKRALKLSRLMFNKRTYSKINSKIRNISKLWFNRRELYQDKRLVKSKGNVDNGFYKRVRKGGIVEPILKYYGKPVIIKVQKYANRFDQFNIIRKAPVLRFHKFRKPYGGTSYNGISKWALFKDSVTNQIIQAKNSKMCRFISVNKQRFSRIEYKKQAILCVK
jgi:hypothetical protein